MSKSYPGTLFALGFAIITVIDFNLPFNFFGEGYSLRIRYINFPFLDFMKRQYALDPSLSIKMYFSVIGDINLPNLAKPTILMTIQGSYCSIII
jgi:hypothetical protein